MSTYDDDTDAYMAVQSMVERTPVTHTFCSGNAGLQRIFA